MHTINNLLVVASMATLMLTAATAWAVPSYMTPVTPLLTLPTLQSPVATPDGPGIVTSNIGSTGITILPNAGGQGLLLNEGNGTSTLIVPNGVPEIVPTPR